MSHPTRQIFRLHAFCRLLKSLFPFYLFILSLHVKCWWWKINNKYFGLPKHMSARESRVKKSDKWKFASTHPPLPPPPPLNSVYDSINVTLRISILKNVMHLCNGILSPPNLLSTGSPPPFPAGILPLYLRTEYMCENSNHCALHTRVQYSHIDDF